jgi:hypothetical protein
VSACRTGEACEHPWQRPRIGSVSLWRSRSHELARRLGLPGARTRAKRAATHRSRAPASTRSGPPRVAVTTRPSGAPSRPSPTARQRGKVRSDAQAEGSVRPREERTKT